MKAKISELAALVMMTGYVVEDADSNDETLSDKDAEELAQTYLNEHKRTCQPFDLDLGNIQVTYYPNDGWYIASDPHRGEIGELMKSLRPS